MNKYFSGKFVCPACRRIIKIDDIEYVCRNTEEVDHSEKNDSISGKTNLGLKTGRSSDPYYFTQRQIDLNFSFFKTSGKRADCPVCGLTSREVVCPKKDCKKPLSFASRVETISITGIKSSGKTVYIASLVKELKKFFTSRNTVCRVNPYYSKEYSKYYELKEGKKLPAGTPTDVRDPIILQVAPGEPDSLDIVIYDIAGENLVADPLKNADKDLKHIALSSMVIYLFDPLQKNHLRTNDPKITRLKKEHNNIVKSAPEKSDKQKKQDENDDVENTTYLADDYAHSDEAIVGFIKSNIEEIIKRECNIDEIDKLPIKIAPTISLLDSFQHIYQGHPEYEIAMKSIDYLNGIPKEQKMVTEAVKKILDEWEEQGPMTEFNNFEDSEYFTVSSIGQEPDPGNLLPIGYTPINVINPVVWLLEKNNSMPKKRK